MTGIAMVEVEMLAATCRTLSLPTRHIRHLAKMASPQSIEYTKDRQHELQENIQGVEHDIRTAYQVSSSSNQSGKSPRLVAVSKLKPASDIKALYDLGYRHFGENYIQELVDKSSILPTDIQWHFIGNLQSNKAKQLVHGVPEGALWVVETLASEKTAGLLEKAVAARGDDARLQVYIQVNTSQEDVKSGVDPLLEGSAASDTAKEHELIKLATYILEECPHLHLLGLMTIGSFTASHDPTKPNPDFQLLSTTRRELFTYFTQHAPPSIKQTIKEKLPNAEKGWELSMGMSADFESAVKQGTSGVRVGTRIFGERAKKVKAGDGEGVTK
ncbi:hypothetical protein QFC22_004712 [Naganishia vaughanmartiniae]|uniref:Uncharacterized protein n=1 Tax=Naganishia vaughanmartiniae TaxID=1424756 RepID=A0ACC2WZ60_9TREE|nr:hypothetical protein QFC22_004712 [Naganishia vaughanmartiniae]